MILQKMQAADMIDDLSFEDWYVEFVRWYKCAIQDQQK